ncbi:hypothetical protein ACHAXT_012090 [Thalassiosira profunda]
MPRHREDAGAAAAAAPAKKSSVMFALTLACALIVPALPLTSPPRPGSKEGAARSSVIAPAGAALPRLHRGLNQPSKIYNDASSTSGVHRGGGAPQTALQMALGGNYLDDIDDQKDGDTTNFREGNDRWGIFGGRSDNNNSAARRGNNRDGGSARGGGAGTAIRPSTPNGSGPGNGYRPGGNGGMEPRGVPRVLSIRQPQDLLDFVIEDERLSVVKVYASWCKTCAVFDIRYRKLASQLGDTFEGDSKVSQGSVRFAEMKYDDPNNEEMCKLLNATKLPYILMYKGSQGKVADFQCGPAKFQMLVDAVEEFADPEGAAVPERRAGVPLGGEQEWRVVREQQQKRNAVMRNEQRAAQYGGGGSIVNYPSASDGDKLRSKEEEVSRLYSELSALRSDFDKRIVQLKEGHQREMDGLQDRIRSQTKEYEEQRRALTSQIESLSRELMARKNDDQSRRSGDDAEAQRLQMEMRQKEEEYQKNLTGLNLRITELEQDLFKKRNELQYSSSTNTNDQQRLSDHIAALEEEIAGLTARNAQLEKELVEEKRVVVASTEEASRVLKQLEKIKNSEDAERRQLTYRIAELEAEIADREKQLINSSGEVSRDIERDLQRLKREHQREKESMAAQIEELEEELGSWRASSSVDSEQSSRRQQRLREEGERLQSRIAELEDEVDERDRLLRTSNKAADILLDNMESQKREYEDELDRANSLVCELEEAISDRENEMEVLRERFDSLERMADELKQREEERDELAAVNGPTQQYQPADEGGQGGDSRWRMERQARMAAEEEVGKLMGLLKGREEEIARMQPQGGGFGGAPAQNQFSFGALFGGGPGGDSSDSSSSSWEALKDVLMPDEVSPTMQTRSGAGRVDNIRGDSGPSPMMPSSGAGRSDNIMDGAGSAFGNTPSPAAADPPAGLPTPAMAFERRLAENPIVPAGAFGGSKPTASFFSKTSSPGQAAMPSDMPEYYQNAMNNFNSRPLNRGSSEEAPATPPMSSFEQRPTAPSPRATANYGMTENIYAGAGSASDGSGSPYAGVGGASGGSASSSSYPSPSIAPREEPAAPLPTPAMAFEQRLAENPIVPAGAFGGSQPTSHFFSPKSAPAAGSGGASSQSFPPPEDDSQSKWQRLDDSEKKRVAADAYKAFEKSLKDGRQDNAQSQPNKGRDTGGRGSGLGGIANRSAASAPKTTKSGQSSQVEMERKKHQDMVRAAATSSAAGQQQPSKAQAKAKSAPPKTSSSPLRQQTQQPQQSARQIQNSAAQASAKRMSLAERAAKAEQERKEREKQVKAGARKAQDQRAAEAKRAGEAKLNEERQRAAEAKRAEEKLNEERQRAAEAKRVAAEAKRAEEAKRSEEIRRAQELARKADADLARAKELERKLSAAEGGKKSPEPGQGSLESKERIEAALLGAEEGSDSPPSPQNAKSDKGSGFAVSKVDVVMLKNPDDLDLPQLLEGSLKDLLSDDPYKRRRSSSSGDSNY